MLLWALYYWCVAFSRFSFGACTKCNVTRNNVHKICQFWHYSHDDIQMGITDWNIKLVDSCTTVVKWVISSSIILGWGTKPDAAIHHLRAFLSTPAMSMKENTMLPADSALYQEKKMTLGIMNMKDQMHTNIKLTLYWMFTAVYFL